MNHSHPMSDTRFASLSYHVTDLLNELRDLDIDPQDLTQAIRIANRATPETIGTVIHHLHILINEARALRTQN